VSARFVVLALVPIAMASYILRTLLLVLLGGRSPRAATAIDVGWRWLPLVVVLIVVTWAQPLLGVAGVVATALFLTSSRAYGSPFRPRR